MSMTYDPEVDALYIKLVEEKVECINVHVSDDVTFNIGPGGLLVGIEVLDATTTLHLPSPIQLDENGCQLVSKVDAAA